MANTLKFGGGTWATKKGSTLAYNDENDRYKPLPFTTTRASGATRVNKEGLIEVVSNDVPRIDYTDSTDGVLLLENSSTNYDSESENFSTSFMSNSAGIQSSALVSETSPSGDNNSVYKISKVTDNADPYIGRSGISFTNTTMVFSVWLWTDEDQPKDVLLLVYRDGVQEVQTENITLTNIPTRYSIEASFTTTPSNVSYRIDLTPNSSNQYIYAWGKQLESGSYATSYIPTQGSTVTRVADTASGSGNSEVFNDSEGVLFADISALTSSDGSRDIEISDGNTNRIIIQYNPSGILQVFVLVNGVATYTFAYTTLIAQFKKIALKYKENDFALWVDGFVADSSNSGSVFSANTLTQLDLLKGVDSSLPFYGKTKQLAYYDTVLTDLELETLTSYRSLNELVTELNLKAL